MHEHLLAAPGRVGVRNGIVGIDGERLLQQRQGQLRLVKRLRVHIRKRAQIEVIGIETVRSLAARPLDLRLLQLRSNGADDAGGHLILQVEDVLDSAIETIRPEMCPMIRR